MTGPSSRVPLLLALVWLGGLLVATSVGLLAVRLVAAQVGDPAVSPLSAAAAASAAAASSPSPRPPAGPPTDQPAPARTGSGAAPVPSTPRPSVGAAPVRTFATPGGTLGVQCTGTSLRLLYATPAQGYALDERSITGPTAEVRFEGRGARVRVRLSCASGAPRLVEQRTDPDSGDDDDRQPDGVGDDGDDD